MPDLNKTPSGPEPLDADRMESTLNAMGASIDESRLQDKRRLRTHRQILTKLQVDADKLNLIVCNLLEEMVALSGRMQVLESRKTQTTGRRTKSGQ